LARINMNYWNKHAEVDQALIEKCRNCISLVIPSLNEEKGIEEVIRASKPFCNEIIVIDGHSSDKTVSVAESLGAACFLDNGKGKGDAIREGISRANHEVVVFIDADMSHDPKDIPVLVKPIFNEDKDMVIGSRPRGGSDELHGDFNKFMRMIGSDIITLGINYRFKVRMTDSQNGFRAIKRVVAKDLGLAENITTIEQEMLIKALKKGFKVDEVPTHEYARKYGESHIKLSRVSLRYVYSWLKYMFF